MATVNKNFKIKSGLVVEGTTATVNGNQVLTESASDQYIIDLIGGETLVTSVESTQMEVISGELNIKSGVFDVSGAAAAAQSAAASDATTKANAAQSAAAADATTKANAAQTAAAADATTKAANAKSEAISAAASDATTKAATAKSEAISAAAADATTKANTARTGADSYTDGKIATEVTDRNSAITTAINTEVTNRNSAILTAKGEAIAAAEDYTDTAVSNLVGAAPSTLNTLQELAAALENNPDIIADLENVAAGKQDTLTAGDNIDITGAVISVTGLDTADVAEDASRLYFTNQRALDATNAAYDPAGSADAAALAAGSDLEDHADLTAAHGATGAVVGTTNTQTLTNKTIGDTLNFTGAGAMTINSDSHIVLTPAAGSDVKWGADVLATENYVDSAVDALDTDAIEEGQDNLYFTSARAIAAVGGTIGDAINDLTTSDIEEGSNLYFTSQRALDATAQAYDAYGSASAADISARGYADGLAVNYDSAGSAAAAYSDAVSAAALDATDKANDAQAAAELTASNALTIAVGNLEDYADTAEQDAKNYADALIDDASSASTKVWSAYKTSTEIGLAQAAAEQHADDAVAALVGSAPQLLDTLQELAAALDNDPETINSLQSIAAGKQDELTAGANINITGATISVTGLDSADISDFNTAALSATSAAYDAAGSADDAQAAAEATAQSALDDVLDGATAFTEINVNSEAKQIAASSSGTATVAGTAYQWAKADYRSAKLLVKIDNGTDNEISEILLTLDSADNIAITEYAIVGTNGSRGTITADISGTNVRVRVTPTNNSTVKVSGTLLK